MKNFLSLIFFSLFIILPANSTNHKTIGEGELKLSDGMIRYFEAYIKTKGGKSPETFVIAIDGSYAMYWFCPTGNCQVGDEADYIKKCEIKSGVECKVFARKRYIKWKNGINPGKGKVSKINSKLDFYELKSKLNELGF